MDEQGEMAVAVFSFAVQVQGGKSFADIAKEHGVSRQQLIDTLLSEVNTKIAVVKARRHYG
ncbi:hypothetical protein [Paenibacillus sp. OV219]|uniref:hypothetical protein n=1 Tax=Paenibacillus sp. OV219 TaxID=1884377 RepID=UPI0008ABCDFD|nr:hypothetical protein [Paenibacillus sp. OV219]SEO05369.1 hypothetical protein SAMN05518847_105360 [Paenibacillus sp. OV219]